MLSFEKVRRPLNFSHGVVVAQTQRVKRVLTIDGDEMAGASVRYDGPAGGAALHGLGPESPHDPAGASPTVDLAGGGRAPHVGRGAS